MAANRADQKDWRKTPRKTRQRPWENREASSAARDDPTDSKMTDLDGLASLQNSKDRTELDSFFIIFLNLIIVNSKARPLARLFRDDVRQNFASC